MRVSKSVVLPWLIGLILIAGSLDAQEYSVLSHKYKNAGSVIGIRGLDLAEDGQDVPHPIEFYTTGINLGDMVSTWSLRVTDGQGNEFRCFAGRGGLPQVIPWDGMGQAGARVSPLANYYVQMQALTAKGQVALDLETDFVGAIPVRPEHNRLRVLMPDLLFQGEGDLLFSNDPQSRALNVELLRNLARKIRDLPEYRIVIQGQAAKGPQSRLSDSALVDLSLRRAAIVREALFTLGVDWPRMNVEGRVDSPTAGLSADLADGWQYQRVLVFLVE